MNTSEKIGLASVVVLWLGVAVGLVFNLAKVDISKLDTHIKVIYFIIFLLFTFVGILYFKIFFQNKENKK